MGYGSAIKAILILHIRGIGRYRLAGQPAAPDCREKTVFPTIRIT